MLKADEILEKRLRDGRDYMYIGGERYRPDDCLLMRNGQEIIIRQIIDQTHFADQRGSCMHSFMFYDQKWEHCFERNADKKTKDRTNAAVVADRVRLEREAFKNDMVKNMSYQVYEDYGRIYFFERVGWHIIKREREPNTKESEALLKLSDNLTLRGVTLLEDMYRHCLLKSANVGSNSI